MSTSTASASSTRLRATNSINASMRDPSPLLAYAWRARQVSPLQQKRAFCQPGYSAGVSLTMGGVGVAVAAVFVPPVAAPAAAVLRSLIPARRKSESTDSDGCAPLLS